MEGGGASSLRRGAWAPAACEKSDSSGHVGRVRRVRRFGRRRQSTVGRHCTLERVAASHPFFARVEAALAGFHDRSRPDERLDAFHLRDAADETVAHSVGNLAV